ncbi:MAG: ABC transporter substrate-binding protein [Candidatus Taylorbacteria bacterium]|nr:ABC transporter substrate-binding protein [Candidatus Taylorbacteria bacterium]
MSKTTKIVVGVIVLILIILGVSNVGKRSVSGGPFKIGVILPLSGPAATMGESSKKSVELALSNIPEAKKLKVEIIYGDDQLDPKQTVSVAQKMIDTDGVSALITYSSPSSVADAWSGSTSQSD